VAGPLHIRGAADRGGRIMVTMTLDELISALAAEDPCRILPLGFSHPHSYRGIYSDVAFEPTRDVTVGQMLADARSAVGTTYQGWKGGDSTMDGYTDVWLSEEGSASDEQLGPILLTLLLAAGQLDAGTQAKLAAFEPEGVQWRRANA
jgi:hypothetical protein